MYYNTQILNKYNLVYTNYITNQAITRQSVPNEYRLINTIICYLDFKGFLHVELFVGTEDEISDEQWIDDTNWVTTAFIYHKCYNEEYNVDFSITALQVPCCVRYRGNILHIQNYPMLDSCGETYYEDKTYRYKCFCCDDDKYSNIDNWEEYDFQLIIDDIVKFITDIMTEANDISYGLTTPDEDVIKDLIEQEFNEWLNDEKLTQIINALLKNWDITRIVESLPETGENYIIYLVPTENNDDGTNKYAEWVWLEDEQRYEPLGSFVDIVIDDALSETSENPVQNKVITEALNRINKELFPLTIAVSGGGLFEKRTTQTITVSWSVKEGSDIVTPDSITVNDETVTNTDKSKQFTNVTTNTTYTVKAIKDGITVTGSTSVTFVNPSYFGAVAADFTPTEEAIKALTKSVKNGKGYTGTTSLNNQKTCYAYPKSFGALTAIKDANNFEYLGSYTRSELQVWDEVYYIYVLTDPVTIDGFKQIYS